MDGNIFMKIGKAENSNLKLVYNDIPNSFQVFIQCKIPLSHHIQVMKFIWAWNMNLTHEKKIPSIYFVHFFFESAKRENCRCYNKMRMYKKWIFWHETLFLSSHVILGYVLDDMIVICQQQLSQATTIWQTFCCTKRPIQLQWDFFIETPDPFRNWLYTKYMYVYVYINNVDRIWLSLVWVCGAILSAIIWDKVTMPQSPA